MKELQTLERWIEELKNELSTIAQRKEALEYLMSLQGYSLKTIKRNTYLYVWKTTEHAKARWKCLGNIDKIGGKQAIKEVRDAKVMVLVQEYALLDKRQRKIKELPNSLVLAIEEGYGKALKEVV